MSDSIQSISQGNYILQGTVATSAGIVGDGSTQNPLRADETVLWENASEGVYAGTITLNEPWSGFNKIGIEVVDVYGWGGHSEQFSTVNLAGSRPKHFTCNYQFIVPGSPNKQYIRGCCLEFANNEFTSGTVISNETNLTPPSSFSCTTGGQAPRLIRVIGINRIANN